METVWPELMAVEDRFKSEPEVPTVPCATQVVPADEVQSRHCTAVPVLAAVDAVIVPNVNTPLDGAAPNGLEHGRETSSVPDAAAAQFEAAAV